MSLMHGQTNGCVVAREEVSAQGGLSKQLGKRHFILRVQVLFPLASIE